MNLMRFIIATELGHVTGKLCVFTILYGTA